jgi:flagellum-specific peptidoglycan hydrolase FlgJ
MVSNKGTGAKMTFTPTMVNIVNNMSSMLQGLLSEKKNYKKPTTDIPQVSTVEPYLSNFTQNEDYNYIDPRDLVMFNDLTIQDKAIITSGLRSLQDNTRAYRANLTSMIDSPHMTGNSVDIRTRPGQDGKAGRALWEFFKTPSGQEFLRKNNASAYYHNAGTGYHIDITTARRNRPAGKVYEKNKKGKMIVYSSGQKQALKNADITNDKVQYVQKYYPIIKDTIKNTGLNIDAGALLTQIALESDWGKSGLTNKNNNFGGIKAYGNQPYTIEYTREYFKNDAEAKKWEAKRKENILTASDNIECKNCGPTGKKKNGKIEYRVRAPFRKYATPEEGIKAIIELISNKNYSKYGTTESMGDPNKYFTAVKAGGYATSPGYVANNMALYNKNILPLLQKYFPE